MKKWYQKLFCTSNEDKIENSKKIKELIEMEEEIPKKSEEHKSPTLQERLVIHKEMTKRITEEKTGYTFNIHGRGNVAFLYNKLGRHYVIEKDDHILRIMEKVVNIFEEKQEKEAKDYCYKELIKYIRKNSHFKYDEFWDKSSFPYKTDSGSISVIHCAPKEFFGEITRESERRKKWNCSDVYTKSKINNSRIKHGLSPLEISL